MLMNDGYTIKDDISSFFNGIRPHDLGISIVVDSPGDNLNSFSYLGYGNEASIHTEYASICIVAAAQGHNVEDKWPKTSSYGW